MTDQSRTVTASSSGTVEVKLRWTGTSAPVAQPYFVLVSDVKSMYGQNHANTGSGTVENGIGSPTTTDQTDPLREHLSTGQKRLKILKPYQEGGVWYVKYSFATNATATSSGATSSAYAEAMSGTITPDGRSVGLSFDGRDDSYHPKVGGGSIEAGWTTFDGQFVSRTSPNALPEPNEKILASDLAWRYPMYVGLELGQDSSTVSLHGHVTASWSGLTAAMATMGGASGAPGLSLALEVSTLYKAWTGSATTGSGNGLTLSNSPIYEMPRSVSIRSESVGWKSGTYVALHDATKQETCRVKASWSDGVTGEAELLVTFVPEREEIASLDPINDVNYTSAPQYGVTMLTGSRPGKRYKFSPGGSEFAAAGVVQYDGTTHPAHPLYYKLEPALVEVEELILGTPAGVVITSVRTVSALIEAAGIPGVQTKLKPGEQLTLRKADGVIEEWPFWNSSLHQVPATRDGYWWRIDKIVFTEVTPLIFNVWGRAGFIGREKQHIFRDSKPSEGTTIFVRGPLWSN